MAVHHKSVESKKAQMKKQVKEESGGQIAYIHLCLALNVYILHYLKHRPMPSSKKTPMTIHAS